MCAPGALRAWQAPTTGGRRRAGGRAVAGTHTRPDMQCTRGDREGRGEGGRRGDRLQHTHQGTQRNLWSRRGHVSAGAPSLPSPSLPILPLVLSHIPCTARNRRVWGSLAFHSIALIFVSFPPRAVVPLAPRLLALHLPCGFYFFCTCGTRSEHPCGSRARASCVHDIVCAHDCPPAWMRLGCRTQV